ncbi:hypothetical protein L209DRAFT_487493 [Thermothelomyces heterothallicus CBS 203.75]
MTQQKHPSNVPHPPSPTIHIKTHADGYPQTIKHSPKTPLKTPAPRSHRLPFPASPFAPESFLTEKEVFALLCPTNLLRRRLTAGRRHGHVFIVVVFVFVVVVVVVVSAAILFRAARGAGLVLALALLVRRSGGAGRRLLLVLVVLVFVRGRGRGRPHPGHGRPVLGAARLDDVARTSAADVHSAVAVAADDAVCRNINNDQLLVWTSLSLWFCLPLAFFLPIAFSSSSSFSPFL